MSYYSLHCHSDRGSNLLFLDSTARPSDNVQYARTIPTSVLGLIIFKKEIR